MKFFILAALALWVQPTWACLNDSSILPDGQWIYEGIWGGRTNGTLEVQIATDPVTAKRSVIYLGSHGPIEIPLTQCSVQPGASDPGTYVYFAQSTATDSGGYKTKINVTLHAVKGRLVFPPNKYATVFSAANYTPQDDQHAYSVADFTAGFCVNRTGGMQWCGTPPKRVK